MELVSITKHFEANAQKAVELSAKNERLAAENAKLWDQIDQPSSDKATLQEYNNLRSGQSQKRRDRSKNKGQQLTKPLSSEAGAVDDKPLTEFPRYKIRNFIKRSLNNKYTISTEEKLQQRKYRKKNKENYKGMKQFFGVNKSTTPTV